MADKQPISVAMPYWNRPGEWERSKAAYAKVYPDLDLEFSLCDDGSVNALRETQDPKVRITRLPTKVHALNPCVPINVAVRNCTNDVIVLTNPEIEHRERVLDKMLSTLILENDYVMTGCRDTRAGEWFAGPDAPRAPIGGRAPIPPGSELHFCVMFHRALFERVGGFDEEYRAGHGYDDNDWLWRLHALGDVNFKYVPGAVWHCKGVHDRSLWKPELIQRNRAIFKRKWGHVCAL